MWTARWQLATPEAAPAVVQAAAVASGAAEVLALAGARRAALADDVARRAHAVALAILGGKTGVELVVIDGNGALLARAGG